MAAACNDHSQKNARNLLKSIIELEIGNGTEENSILIARLRYPYGMLRGRRISHSQPIQLMPHIITYRSVFNI